MEKKSMFIYNTDKLITIIFLVKNLSYSREIISLFIYTLIQLDLGSSMSGNLLLEIVLFYRVAILHLGVRLFL